MKSFLLAGLLVFVCSISTAPDQIRLSWTGTQGEMKVVWVAYGPVTASLSYRSLCSPTSPWVSVRVQTKTYTVGSSPVSTEWISSGVISGLLPGCSYDYQVANNQSQSAVLSFSGRTPANNNDGASVKMLLVADWGTGTSGSLVAKYMVNDIEANAYDALIHLGDFAYALEDNNGLNGDVFLNMIMPVTSTLPYMVLPGNHEKASNFSQYVNRFYMPVTSANQGTSFFYSFNLGAAHYVMINTEAYFYLSTTSQKIQMNWLVADLNLANQNRATWPWLIVMGHRPLYCASFSYVGPKNTSNTCLSEADLLRSIFEDLFYQNGVDLYIQAHLHQYERMTPIYKNQTVKSAQDTMHMHVGAKAPIYITNGVAGSTEGMHNEQDPTDWLVYWSIALGYGRMTVFNTTHLYYEQVSAQKNTIIDYVWIVKTQNRY
jgi:acid phosphatase type 7